MSKKIQEESSSSRDLIADFNISVDDLSNITDNNQWFEQDFEGQLSLDVYEKENTIIIKSAIAGVDYKDLDISINNDILTIRGVRNIDDSVSEDAYYFRECYWGKFSRSVILPTEVNAEAITATLNNGVLTIELPKMNVRKKIDVKVVK